jgi:hypothetical protein
MGINPWDYNSYTGNEWLAGWQSGASNKCNYSNTRKNGSDFHGDGHRDNGLGYDLERVMIKVSLIRTIRNPEFPAH